MVEQQLDSLDIVKQSIVGGAQDGKTFTTIDRKGKPNTQRGIARFVDELIARVLPTGARCDPKKSEDRSTERTLPTDGSRP